MPDDLIIKTKSGYERDDRCARYLYNHKGEYLGQYQPDMLSEDSTAGELWFATHPGDKCYHELTQAQMENAE